MSDTSYFNAARANACGTALITGVILLSGAWGSNLALAQSQPAHANVSIATQLKEVQSGTIDGRDYLTLTIGGHVIGPSSCRGNVLRMDTSGAAGAKRQEEIEAIAITAMLTGSIVMIDVPLDLNQCVDGKPTFTNLYQIAPNP